MKENLDLKLVIAIARAHSALFSKVEKHLRNYDLTLSEFGVLEMLYHKGTQPVQQIAEKILVTSGTITYIINKLQERGFVERKKCQKDKRIFYVELTETGEKVISSVFPEHEKYLHDIFSHLDILQKDKMISDLFYLKDCINQFDE